MIIKPKQKRGKLIFRTKRRCPRTGKVLNARDYGHKAWPIWIAPK